MVFAVEDLSFSEHSFGPSGHCECHVESGRKLTDQEKWSDFREKIRNIISEKTLACSQENSAGAGPPFWETTWLKRKAKANKLSEARSEAVLSDYK